MPTRNFCVARGHLASGAFTSVFSVPDNHSFIFKSLKFTLDAIVTATLYVGLQDVRTGLVVYTAIQQFTTAQMYAYSDWSVLNATDRVILQCNGGSGNYWISGALLPYDGVVPPITAAVTFEAPSAPPPFKGPEAQHVRITP